MSNLTPVASVRPVAPYVGGKRNSASRLVKRIESIPHTRYAEPFVGMGGKVEVINDLSGDVANLFRILQRHYPQFMDTLRFGVTSRREFERLARTDPATLTDLERAGRFLFLQVTAFGGKVTGRNFGVDLDASGGFNVNRLGPLLEAVHERLASVTIEQLEFETFIRRYDREGTLFYCDPPYWGSEDYYGAELFTRADFERLAGALQAMRGRFILSINDVPQIRELFVWASIEPLKLTYGLASGATAANELVITGGA